MKTFIILASVLTLAASAQDLQSLLSDAQRDFIRGDKTAASFAKDTQTKRYVFKQGKGSATLIAMMREDFEGEKPPV